MKYKIGDFAKIVGTTVRTLRYYNEMGILIPDEIDLYTNYRYYTDKQIRQYKEIKYLQEAGFSINEIVENKNKWNDEIFDLKRKELLSDIEEKYKQILAIDYLRRHNHEGILNIDKAKSLTKKKEMEYGKNIS